MPDRDSPNDIRTSTTEKGFHEALLRNLLYSRGQNPHFASDIDAYVTLATTVRDHLMRRWRNTVEKRFAAKPRYVCYLSAEYLLGRQLEQNLLYTGTTELARKALKRYGLDLGDYIESEIEPGLGNGGLGRLAACFIDSLATLNVPCVAYGLRYEFGIFKQSFRDGWQSEAPDDWLFHGNPWEFRHSDDIVEVGFGGTTKRWTDSKGHYRVKWIPETRVLGEPVHMMVPGYQTETVNLLRLWKARATKEFDFQMFDSGDYARAVHQKTESENLTKVLYPNDNTPQGKELRLKQQYFFVSCTLQDIIRRVLAMNGEITALPEKTVIQLNDTHPVLAIPELMRLLVDEYDMGWEDAWGICEQTFAYTCHTLLPEALEEWPVDLFRRLLPRHWEIVSEIDRRFREDVARRFPGDTKRVERMSIVKSGRQSRVRMAHLASAVSFSVNGVAKLQSELLKTRVLKDFAEMYPDRFNNKTNGVTPRRWMLMANPTLSELITTRIGPGWIQDMTQLRQLADSADDPAFIAQWQEVKNANKNRLAGRIESTLELEVDPASLFDVMVKRLHEYKRQTLKTLHIITMYQRLKAHPDADIAPRTFIFGAKAAPGYRMAKLIIHLINSVADVVNNDADVAGRLRVAFLPNFNVSLGEIIYPGADLSEQISMAGKEASGTGNMKFMMNGALTIGTLDGANIEIREGVGDENFFLFGLRTQQVFDLKASGYNPRNYIDQDDELRLALEAIDNGFFSNGDGDRFQPLIDHLTGHDEFLVCADYRAYVDAQDAVAEAYLDPAGWTRKSILNTANSGHFSSDRSMREYCRDIWNVPVIDHAMTQ